MTPSQWMTAVGLSLVIFSILVLATASSSRSPQQFLLLLSASSLAHQSFLPTETKGLFKNVKLGLAICWALQVSSPSSHLQGPVGPSILPSLLLISSSQPVHLSCHLPYSANTLGVQVLLQLFSWPGMFLPCMHGLSLHSLRLSHVFAETRSTLSSLFKIAKLKRHTKVDKQMSAAHRPGEMYSRWREQRVQRPRGGNSLDVFKEYQVCQCVWSFLVTGGVGPQEE